MNSARLFVFSGPTSLAAKLNAGYSGKTHAKPAGRSAFFLPD